MIQQIALGLIPGIILLLTACKGSPKEQQEAAKYRTQSMKIMRGAQQRVDNLNALFEHLLVVQHKDSLRVEHVLKYDSLLTADKYAMFAALDSLRALPRNDSYSVALQKSFIALMTLIEREHKNLYLLLQMEPNAEHLAEMRQEYRSALKREGQIGQAVDSVMMLFGKRYALPEQAGTGSGQWQDEYRRVGPLFDALMASGEVMKKAGEK